jgi:bacterioferritin (cytochrome b1)
MGRLADYDTGQVINVLSERLAFERAGVRLYDKILEKMQESGDKNILRMNDAMTEHRNQEKEHEEWLESQIRGIGGDAHAPTELSELVTRESEGIEKVVMSDPELPHLFHALLAAELVDNAGWDLLVQLADDAGDSEAKRSFKKRLREEEAHLTFLRRVMEKFSAQQVLNEQVRMPDSP